MTKDEVLDLEGRKFPGATYSRAVLLPAYEHAKQELLDHMRDVNVAHLVMLRECSLVTQENFVNILRALESVDYDEVRTSKYTGQFEDLFFRVEHDVMELAGELGGTLHLARSRNDMGVTMYRMALRRRLLQVATSICELRDGIFEISQEHVDTIMLAYTHTQQAQPTTFAHYLMAVFDSLGRDFKRVMNAYRTCNRSPMGAAALTTTGFPIDRYRVAELLGFSGIVENSYDAIGGADYLAESASAYGTLFIGIGRYTQDLLLLSTQEFSGIRVADPYVQISSIMPQKRNPVSLEHIRALSSSGLGSAMTVMQMLHNTPFGDIVDTEDDLQPNLWRSANIATDVLNLLTVVMRTLDVNADLLLARATASYASITELADTLVREAGLPFRTAHKITSEAVKIALYRGLSGDKVDRGIVNEAAVLITGREVNVSDLMVSDAMSPRNFVKRRKVSGGPSPEEVRRGLMLRWQELETDKQEVLDSKGNIHEAEQVLHAVAQRWSQA